MSEGFAYSATKPGRRKSRGKKVAALTGSWLAIAGIAFAAWLLIPQGSGSLFGRSGTAAQGLALTSDEDSGFGNNLTGITPGDTVAFRIRVRNSNTVPVTLTRVAQSGTATDVTDPSCVIPAGALTFPDLVNPANGTIPPPGSGNTRDFDIAVTASSSFPICAAGGHSLSLPVSLTGVASP